MLVLGFKFEVVEAALGDAVKQVQDYPGLLWEGVLRQRHALCNGEDEVGKLFPLFRR